MSSGNEYKDCNFFFTTDNRDLSEEEYRIAEKQISFIKETLKRRDDYISDNNLDKDIHLPRGMWSRDRKFYNAYRQVLSGKREIINRLRVFTPMFTGYYLHLLSISEGKTIFDGVPKNLDEQIKSKLRGIDRESMICAQVMSQIPNFLRISPPTIFGEIGWLIEGRIVNPDSYRFLERIMLLYESGIIQSLMCKPFVKILEIGAGFGGIAYHISKIIPNVRYVVVDIPESLIFSSIYLSITRSSLLNEIIGPDRAFSLPNVDPGISFVPNFKFDDVVKSGLRFDLILNTLSMSEMSEAQVRYYCIGIKELLGWEGVFFEQNQNNSHLNEGLNAKEIIAQYFRYGKVLSSKYFHGLSQGCAHLWRAQNGRS